MNNFGLGYFSLFYLTFTLNEPRVFELALSSAQGLTGKQWYELDAVRAVNQAVGRVIRHSKDFGAVLLCDCRYVNPSVQNTLSMWLRSHLVKCPEFGPAYGKVSKFFKAMGVSVSKIIFLFIC